ncbi:MAG: glycosyltransferase 87 family protein [Thermoplasmata archaeon]
MVSTSDSPRRWPLASRGWIIFVGGFVLREALSFWTGQPYDMESWIRTGFQVSQGTNPYSGFWPAVPGVSFAYPTELLPAAAYLPFWSLLLGEIYRLWDLVGGGNRFVLYFLIKQPGILADVASSYLLYQLARRWTSNERTALRLLFFWAFFPYAIVITAIWGQFDSIVVVVVLFLLWARGPIERNLLYGVGILVKWLTIVFLPLEVLRERGFRRLVVLVALAVPIALTVAVFVAEGWSVSHLAALSTSQGHGGGLGMNLAFPLSLTQAQSALSGVPYFYSVVPFAWVPGVIAAGWVAAKWVGGDDPAAELRALILIVTVFLLLRWGLYEQYMLYLFAPVALDVATFHPGRRVLLASTFGLSALYLIVNNDLGLRFITPADPGVFAYTVALDASSGWGLARTVALAVLAILVTVTLIQWIRTILRDEPRPWPWLLFWWRDSASLTPSPKTL